MRATTWLNTLCLSARKAAALAAVAACGLLIGCGGDDEDETAPSATTPTQAAPAPVTTPPPETTPQAGKAPKGDPDAEPRTVPAEEYQGDEEPIRSEAVFTGRGGKLGPRVVRVPAFIAIRVILRGTDASREQGYSLTIGGKRLAIGHVRAVDEVELPGLLPNKAYEGRGPQGNVRVEATAEPGP